VSVSPPALGLKSVANRSSARSRENSEVFQLCHEVLDKANKPSLIKATLETLLRFLNWIPLGLFELMSLVGSVVFIFVPL
jgi:Exportin 1-like protein